MKILMIKRASRFSPNSVAKDLAILEAVGSRLRGDGHQVYSVSEEQVEENMLSRYDCIFTMARSPETLAWLKTRDARIINSPEGVENSTRSRLLAIMERIGTPIPPKEGPDGYWLKRGDAATQEPGDVVYAPDNEALDQAIAAMRQRGITDYTVSAHVVGDEVKFYGVLGTGFFRYFYPSPAHHYAFDVADLQREAERLAQTVGIEVYGGDCIVKEDGCFCLIDFNDWPSFSRCREDAAEAIASVLFSNPQNHKNDNGNI